jgi:hypothetical protein
MVIRFFEIGGRTNCPAGCKPAWTALSPHARKTSRQPHKMTVTEKRSGGTLLPTIHGFTDYLPLIADWIASRIRGSMRS